MDQINESADILVQYGGITTEDSDSPTQMIQLSPSNSASKRSLFSIQQRYISILHEYFNKKNWLLLPTYAMTNTMYLCPKIEFEQKVSDHFTQTNAYELITKYSDAIQTDLQDFFQSIVHLIDSELHDLLRCQQINSKQHCRMVSSEGERDKNQIPSMVFLPDSRTEIVRFRPMLIHSLGGSLTFISQYLYQYLQPFYLLAVQTSTFNNGVDVVEALENFTRQGRLKPRTLFVTYEIHNFDLIFNHEEMITVFEDFLSEYLPAPSSSTTTTPPLAATAGVELNLSQKTIVQLVRLILQMQYFVYDNKLYRQTKGGNPNSPITKLLVDIYLFYWQQELRDFIRRKKQLFGRCYNQIFLTWNKSKRQFYSYFQQIQTKLPALPIQFLSVEKSVHYLDVAIEQKDGILQTNVYRSRLIERYTLPHPINYALDEYAALIRHHLIRAVRLCNNVRNFHGEHLFIYPVCLLYRLPLNFITDCVHQFFNEFNPSQSHYQYDRKTYEILRRNVRNNTRVSYLLSMNRKRSNHEHLDIETSVKRMKT